jgi:site-specific recombinase XerD
MYKEIGIKAGIITNITTYTMRHTFSVDYMNNDGRLEDLAEMLGHANLKTTRIYGKISEKRLAGKTKHLESKSKMHQLHPQLKAV